jgi:hypothetical protein
MSGGYFSQKEVHMRSMSSRYSPRLSRPRDELHLPCVKLAWGEDNFTLVRPWVRDAVDLHKTGVDRVGHYMDGVFSKGGGVGEG